MASRPLLYSMDISHYCIAADRMLAFKGVEFDIRPVPYHDKQELIKATGQDYVPTLIWDGKTVTWSEIPDFLEGKASRPHWRTGATRSSRSASGGMSSRKSRRSCATIRSGGCSRRCRRAPAGRGMSSRCAARNSGRT
ncbi:MAG: hypothetical protein E6K07_03345 [Methanobacteriota archaeon]|nr:MAG: hypothetical protein E6K07_03345 [Euryarchaeota archaeon]